MSGDLKKSSRLRRLIGWIAVAVSITLASKWAFWGILENFHEGWYHHDLVKNLAMLFGQYLFATILIIAAALIALRWRWVGAVLHVAGVVFLLWFFWGIHPQVLTLLCVPLLLLAAGYAFGTARPRWLACSLLIGIPSLVTVGFGIEPAIRVANRVDDMDRGARRITGNGVDLIWAPRGPGWPQPGGASWDEAVEICRHLSADGTTLLESPQNIWRLPTVEEFVRSQHRSGANCQGAWDADTARPTYKKRPDKESPLWATDGNVIYWWIGTEVDEDRAYKVSYQGTVRPAAKSSSFPYWGFRAVKEPDQVTSDPP